MAERNDRAYEDNGYGRNQYRNPRDYAQRGYGQYARGSYARRSDEDEAYGEDDNERARWADQEESEDRYRYVEEGAYGRERRGGRNYQNDRQDYERGYYGSGGARPYRGGYGAGSGYGGYRPYRGGRQQGGYFPGGSRGYRGQNYGGGYGGQDWSDASPPDYRDAGYGQLAYGAREQGYGRHWGRGPKNYTRSDDRIQEDVNDRLTEDHDLDATNIDVKVSNCEVTLSGTVADRWEKRRAEDCAESVSGVKNVQNNIRVQNGNTGESSARKKTGGAT